MRQFNILSAVGTTTLDLGEVEFIAAGQRVLIAACDSVATATLRVTFGGIDVANGPINIEGSTDRCVWPEDIVGSFIARAGGKMIATLGGTVAGARTNFLVLNSNESVPW